MGGIPKFLLPTGHETETLLGRWISFGLQHFDQIIIPTNPIFYPIVSTLFEAEKVRVAQVETNSMAETVALFKGPGHTCVFMPDTYVSNIEQDFAELATVTSQVNSCFVGTWKIRDYQKGKVGQLDINIDGSLAEVIDKDPLSELERFWGGLLFREDFFNYIEKTDGHLGVSINRALQAAERIGTIDFDSEYYDCGTPLEYVRLLMDNTRGLL